MFCIIQEVVIKFMSFRKKDVVVFIGFFRCWESSTVLSLCFSCFFQGSLIKVGSLVSFYLFKGMFIFIIIFMLQRQFILCIYIQVIKKSTIYFFIFFNKYLMYLFLLNGILILKEMKFCCIFKICYQNLEMKKMIVICL